MVLAPLVLTAVGVIFIMQIITIIQIGKITKLVRNRQERQSEPFRTSTKKHMASQDAKKYKKNQAGGGFQSKEKKAVTSVEKSLRDINLRLKNAERDQERARKKLGGGPSRDSDRRPDKGRKQIKRHRRDRDRDRDRKQNLQRRTPNDVSNNQTRLSQPSSQTEEVSLESLKAAPVPNQNQTPANSGDQGFGRGSQITVKRRTLESKTREDAPQEQPAEVTSNTSTSETQDVSFGRR